MSKTQKERMRESRKRVEQAEKEHQELCKEILKEIDEKGEDDGSIARFEKLFFLENDADPLTKKASFPLEVHMIDTGGPYSREGSVSAGSFVAVRPCGEEYEGKTFLGIYIADIALRTFASFDKESGVLRFKPAMYNPAIFVPDLGKVVYGCESWWGEITSEEDLKDITVEDINDVWYVKLLKQLGEPAESASE